MQKYSFVPMGRGVFWYCGIIEQEHFLSSILKILYFSLVYPLYYLQKIYPSPAVNFHPHDVAFLLIDYKGGGMANLFKNLPTSWEPLLTWMVPNPCGP